MTLLLNDLGEQTLRPLWEREPRVTSAQAFRAVLFTEAVVTQNSLAAPSTALGAPRQELAAPRPLGEVSTALRELARAATSSSWAATEVRIQRSFDD